MPLVYDPSALRYESTQQAYGQTWTLQRIEDDGAQLWRNGQGQEALVPCMQSNVRKYDEEILTSIAKKKIIDNAIDDTKVRTGDVWCKKFGSNEPAYWIPNESVDNKSWTIPSDLPAEPVQRYFYASGGGGSANGNRTTGITVGAGGGMTQSPEKLGPWCPPLGKGNTIMLPISGNTTMTGFAYQQPIKMHETLIDKQFCTNGIKVGHIATSTDGKRHYQWNGTDWNPMVRKPLTKQVSTNSHEYGMFAGQRYLKREFVYTDGKKPSIGDRSVSGNSRYLYEHRADGWWVIGKDNYQVTATRADDYFKKPCPKVGDEKLSSAGTVIRWDGTKWRNV